MKCLLYFDKLKFIQDILMIDMRSEVQHGNNTVEDHEYVKKSINISHQGKFYTDEIEKLEKHEYNEKQIHSKEGWRVNEDAHHVFSSKIHQA